MQITNQKLQAVLKDIGEDRLVWIYERWSKERQQRYAYNKRRNKKLKAAMEFAEAHPDFKG